MDFLLLYHLVICVRSAVKCSSGDPKPYERRLRRVGSEQTSAWSPAGGDHGVTVAVKITYRTLPSYHASPRSGANSGRSRPLSGFRAPERRRSSGGRRNTISRRIAFALSERMRLRPVPPYLEDCRMVPQTNAAGA
jgi:hypothetical protein